MSSSMGPTLPSLHSLLLPTLSVPARLMNVREMLSPDEPMQPISSWQRRASVSSSVTSGSSRTPSPTPPSSDCEPSTEHIFRVPSPDRMPSFPSRSPSPSSIHEDTKDTIDSKNANSTFRLVPTSLPNAEAILFVPPPPRRDSTAQTPLSQNGVPLISRLARKAHAAASARLCSDRTNHNSSLNSLSKGSNGQALLLVGPAMKHLRGSKGIRFQISRGAKIYPYKIVRADTRDL